MERRIQEHKFSNLSEKDRWNLCFAAQNRLPYYFNLLVIPKFVDTPRLYEFNNKYPQNVEVTKQGIAIKCSSLPAMYVRYYYETRDDLIKISFNLDDFQAPKL